MADTLEFGKMIDRPTVITGGAAGDSNGLVVPDQIVNEIIQTATESSVLLQRGRTVRMTSKRYKQPVLASLPDAKWVNEAKKPHIDKDSLKQTTEIGFEPLVMTAEEMAIIVPIPDSLVDDANVPLWSVVRPLVAEAIGRKLDQAGIFGIDKPESWPEALVPAALGVGNKVPEFEKDTVKDLGQAVAMGGQLLAQQGFAANGFLSEPGLQWKLIGLRSENGFSIYTPARDLAPGNPSGLYGYPLNEVVNGAWDSKEAVLVGADWSKVMIGVRQDVTYDVFREGVISDDSGKVLLNLLQQDASALRVVFRVAYQVANPITRVQPDPKKRFPAFVVTPAGTAPEAKK